MSSFLIGLNINDSQTTSALLRLGPCPTRSLLIERDTYFTRSHEIDDQTDLKDIIAIWLACLEDLLRDFLVHLQENEKIIGIAVSVGSPMDFNHDVCRGQSGLFRKLEGLNLRLSLRYALKQLVSRWKRFYLLSTSNFLDRKVPHRENFSRQQQTRPMTIVVPFSLCTFTLPSTIINAYSENKTPGKATIDFCGRHNQNEICTERTRNRSRISEIERRSYFHDSEQQNRSETTTKTDRITPKVWSMIEQLVTIPITFHSEASCLAFAESMQEQNFQYERILVLTLGVHFGSAFMDRGELIINRDDVPFAGDLAQCPIDQNSIADDWFSTRGLMKIYCQLIDEHSKNNLNNENFAITQSSFARLASLTDPLAMKTFEKFSQNFTKFLIPYIERFRADLIVIGGDVSRVWKLLEQELIKEFRRSCSAHVYFSVSSHKLACLGAAHQQSQRLRTIPDEKTSLPSFISDR